MSTKHRRAFRVGQLVRIKENFDHQDLVGKVGKVLACGGGNAALRINDWNKGHNFAFHFKKKGVHDNGWWVPIYALEPAPVNESTT